MPASNDAPLNSDHQLSATTHIIEGGVGTGATMVGSSAAGTVPTSSVDSSAAAALPAQANFPPVPREMPNPDYKPAEAVPTAAVSGVASTPAAPAQAQAVTTGPTQTAPGLKPQAISTAAVPASSALATPQPVSAATTPPSSANTSPPSTLLQPKPISVVPEHGAAPVAALAAAAPPPQQKTGFFHRRTPSESHSGTASASKPPTAPAPKKEGNFLQRIFHIHDDDDHKKPSTPPVSASAATTNNNNGSGTAPAAEKKKEPNLVDKLFHRGEKEHRPDSAGSDRPQTPASPALLIQTASHESQTAGSGSGSGSGRHTPSTPTNEFGSGLGIFRELWSGSPAPSDSSGDGTHATTAAAASSGSSSKRAASLSRPASGSLMPSDSKPQQPPSGVSLKRTNSEQYLASKYGEIDGKVIGRGATSVVRLAHKKDLPGGATVAQGEKGEEKTFAIKEFRKRRRDESERDYVKKLSTEFCIGHSLHHPNVVDHIELLQTQQGAWCEVLEYCSGGDLCSLIQHGGLTYDEANGFFAQLVNGVAYMHTLGVAHKDLKPENLMLDGKGSLKITDFGSAEVFRNVWEKEAHKSHRLAGSEPYIAPEEFTEKEFDPRAVDVWACGIIYLTMIYNRIPWRSATGADPNYKFYVRCRTKYAEKHQLPGSVSEKRSPKDASTATLVGKDAIPISSNGEKDEKHSSKSDLSRSNSAQIARAPSDANVKSHKSHQSTSGASGEPTSFPMLDHLPSGPRNLIFRMLDPNPESRIRVEDVRKDAWFRNIVKSHLGDAWMEKSDVETEKALAAKKAQLQQGVAAVGETSKVANSGPHGPSKLSASSSSAGPGEGGQVQQLNGPSSVTVAGPSK